MATGALDEGVRDAAAVVEMLNTAVDCTQWACDLHEVAFDAPTPYAVVGDAATDE